MSSPGRGHRSLPHTSDATLEAWGPTRAACLSEAVAALRDVFVGGADRTRARTVTRVLGPAADDAELLALVLDEVVFLVDTDGVVVAAEVADGDDGGVVVGFEVVPGDDVEVVGPPPKAVTHHGLELGRDGAGWRGRVTVDV